MCPIDGLDDWARRVLLQGVGAVRMSGFRLGSLSKMADFIAGDDGEEVKLGNLAGRRKFSSIIGCVLVVLAVCACTVMGCGG